MNLDLVFSRDDALIPEQAKTFYDRVKSEKQPVWGTGYHFSFYDVFPEMMQAVDAAVPFHAETFGAANGRACKREWCTNGCDGN